jgi:P2-related tail formation protein
LSQAQDVLTRLNAWSNDGESEADFFHQKAILLEALARRTIGTPVHADVLDSFVVFLEQNSYQDVTPIDWFFGAELLLETNAISNGANADLKRLVDSREPVLSVYARLQSLLRSAKQTPAGKYPTEGVEVIDTTMREGLCL